MEKMYPFTEVAEAWHCSLAIVKKLHSQRAFDVVKLGSKNFVRATEIERFINQNTISAI